MIDPNAKLWRIIVSNDKGGLTHIPDLTLADARHIYERLDPHFGQYAETIWREGQSSAEGDMEWKPAVHRTVIGPPAWDHAEVEKWPRWPQEHDIWFKADGTFDSERWTDEYPQDYRRSAAGKTLKEYT